MAAGSKSTFTLYDDLMATKKTEVIQQNTNAFNANSNNAILMTSENQIGDYSKRTFFAHVASGVGRRDVTSVSAQTASSIANAEQVSVKLSRKFKEIQMTVDSLQRLGFTSETLSLALGEQYAIGKLADMLNSGLLACVASMLSNSDIIQDYSTEIVNYSQLNDALFKFGDQQSKIVAWVMHSSVMRDLNRDAITKNIFGVTDKIVNIAGPSVTLPQSFIQGRPVIVTDSSALYSSGVYYVLGLAQGAIQLTESQEEKYLFDPAVGGYENIMARFQAEFDYTLGILGYTYGTTGGANPADTVLGSSSYWSQTVTDDKDTAGVMLKCKINTGSAQLV